MCRDEEIGTGDRLAVDDHCERIVVHRTHLALLANEASVAIDRQRERADVLEGIEQRLVGKRQRRLSGDRSRLDETRRKPKPRGERRILAQRASLASRFLPEERGAQESRYPPETARDAALGNIGLDQVDCRGARTPGEARRGFAELLRELADARV